jgi:4-hydroxy-tetrahydrodipicolinate synthase
MTANAAGVWVPVLTPFDAKLAPDRDRFIAFCRWLLAQGADGLCPFGTTSEANSLSVEERMGLLESLIAAGIPPSKLMPGTGLCALTDTARLTAHAVGRGCRGVLMLPPFYYKAVDDDGIYAAFAEVIERVADQRLRVYLYHIPPVAQVGIGFGVIERLLNAYPSSVVGIKDSSGDWKNTQGLLDRFPGFAVFPGAETFLLQGMRAGGAGCISATANVNAAAIRGLYANWREPDAEQRHARIAEIRRTIEAYPAIAALKTIVANALGDPQWNRVRPPLTKLAEARAKKLLADLAALGFTLDAHGARAAAE